MIDINRAVGSRIGIEQRERATRGQRKRAPGEVIDIASETDAEIFAVYLQHVAIAAGEQIKLRLGSVPSQRLGALIQKTPADQKPIAKFTDPCAAGADVDHIEVVL